ncbi:helix-turn-helix domain-containing protein [Chryseobacterium sp.]|uniref:helix-turn-helix domain-containing protein n=1 Tax=Chryseobacterium sp. TaxID=1871047 RepID=UPI00321B23A0
MAPDYKQIYADILQEKCPEKLSDAIIKKKLETLDSAINILKFNKLVFGDSEFNTEFNNQRLRSYDEDSILEILKYQERNGLSNLQLSNHFKISRNTISKWKSIFKI